MKLEISNFLDEHYKEYAMYVVEHRAIPSVIDSFKPTQRKVIHISNRIWKNGGSSMKVFQLTGRVTAEAFYSHGDASANSVIINMAQKFKNNLPLLEEVGQFGTLRSPDAGAPRYIATKLNKAFYDVYKDFELLEEQEEEGNKIEPKFFLPIIPMLLVNGSKGIAVGHASNILGRDTKSIIKQCINWLDGKRLTTIKPKIQQFDGSWSSDPDNKLKWYATGIFERKNTSTIVITELPPSMTYEKFENHLDKLVDDKKITSYEDNCRSNINYTIKMQRQKLKQMSDDDVVKMLKLQETETENFTTLDEDGKLLVFEDFKDIVSYFMEFRLVFYQKRKDYMLSNYRDKLKVLSNKARFIKMIIDDELTINKRKRSAIENELRRLKFAKINSSYNYLLNLYIDNLTKEQFEKLLQQKSEIEKLIKDVENKTPEQLFKEDLLTLENKL